MSRPAQLVALALTLTTTLTAASAPASAASQPGPPTTGSTVAIDVEARASRWSIVQTYPANEYDFQGGCRGADAGADAFQGGCNKNVDGWATFPSSRHAVLAHVGDMSGAGPYEGTVVASVLAGPAFRPESVRVGIIAILIGLVVQRAPIVSFQDGDDLLLYVFDGSSLRLLARQAIPEGQTATSFYDLLISSYL